MIMVRKEDMIIREHGANDGDCHYNVVHCGRMSVTTECFDLEECEDPVEHYYPIGHARYSEYSFTKPRTILPGEKRLVNRPRT